MSDIIELVHTEIFRRLGGRDPENGDEYVLVLRKVLADHPDIVAEFREAIDPAARAYGQRQRELHEFNPDLAKAVDAVADARRSGQHITLGDPGFRKSVADVSLAKIANPDVDDDTNGEVIGPKSAEIARRKRARRRREEGQ